MQDVKTVAKGCFIALAKLMFYTLSDNSKEHKTVHHFASSMVFLSAILTAEIFLQLYNSQFSHFYHPQTKFGSR